MVINMVASLDGRVSVGGKAGSIGGPTDRALMRALRAQADAVMTGAGTLRAEKLSLSVPEHLACARKARGLRPQPLSVIVTATGDVPLRTNLLGSSPDGLLVLASPASPEERLAALSSCALIETVPEDKALRGSRLDLSSALKILKDCYGVDVLLVEGGPTLNYALVSSGLADELFLTLAPKLLGGEKPAVLTILEGPPLSPSRGAGSKLLSVHVSGDELFLRYALSSEDE